MFTESDGEIKSKITLETSISTRRNFSMHRPRRKTNAPVLIELKTNHLGSNHALKLAMLAGGILLRGREHGLPCLS